MSEVGVGIVLKILSFSLFSWLTITILFSLSILSLITSIHSVMILLFTTSIWLSIFILSTTVVFFHLPFLSWRSTYLIGPFKRRYLHFIVLSPLTSLFGFGGMSLIGAGTNNLFSLFLIILIFCGCWCKTNFGLSFIWVKIISIFPLCLLFHPSFFLFGFCFFNKNLNFIIENLITKDQL